MDPIQVMRHRHQAALASLSPEQWWAVELMFEARTMASFPRAATARRQRDLYAREATRKVREPDDMGAANAGAPPA